MEKPKNKKFDIDFKAEIDEEITLKISISNELREFLRQFIAPALEQSSIRFNEFCVLKRYRVKKFFASQLNNKENSLILFSADLIDNGSLSIVLSSPKDISIKEDLKWGVKILIGALEVLQEFNGQVVYQTTATGSLEEQNVNTGNGN